MKQATTKLLVFSKTPVEGQVKTRMQPVYTPAQSLALHKHLTCHTLSSVSLIKNTQIELCCTPDIEHEFIRQCQDEFSLALSIQQGDDLGEKMYNALAKQLEFFNKVLIIGTDCPGIDRDYIDSAIQQLDKSEVVLGPASDGGYVLVGMREKCHDIFSGIQWGSDKVLSQTKEILSRDNISYSLLTMKHDIDRPQDLEQYPELIKVMNKR